MDEWYLCMSKVKLVCFNLIIIVMTFLMVSACDESKKSDLTVVLKESFSGIYLSRYSKDYPFTKDVLGHCIKNKYEPCLKIYHRVVDAKNTIISSVSDESLEITLNIIESECMIKDDIEASINCHGGIMSLYFYNSPENDKYMLSRLKKYSEQLKILVFNNDYLWHYNRPDRDLWVKYIETADINWRNENRKENIIEMFNKDISEVRGEPWVFM